MSSDSNTTYGAPCHASSSPLPNAIMATQIQAPQILESSHSEDEIINFLNNETIQIRSSLMGKAQIDEDDDQEENSDATAAPPPIPKLSYSEEMMINYLNNDTVQFRSRVQDSLCPQSSSDAQEQLCQTQVVVHEKEDEDQDILAYLAKFE